MGDPSEDVRCALLAHTRHTTTHLPACPWLTEGVGGWMLQDTFIGPIISEGDAKRIEGWVNAAVARGARILTGGKRTGVMYGTRAGSSRRPRGRAWPSLIPHAARTDRGNDCGKLARRLGPDLRRRYGCLRACVHVRVYMHVFVCTCVLVPTTRFVSVFITPAADTLWGGACMIWQRLGRCAPSSPFRTLRRWCTGSTTASLVCRRVSSPTTCKRHGRVLAHPSGARAHNP
jgi:hypothetical protein